MSTIDTNTDRSYQTNTSSLVPPTSLPKHFNVPFAIQHGYFRSVRYLLQLCYDPNERDSQLRTPLILCSYVENDRWCLSLAQNLLEKGAKIALEDHARRNALHHACALQRIHLVQLYLSCLDFNIEAKDCEGNTCLHYVAITGNCEIAELLIKSAEKIGVQLDQYVNREGCSAAVLALKYGHIECANQITHRDWDEFFVVPRPLSIYETPPSTDVNHPTSTTTITKKKNKSVVHDTSTTTKTDIRPSALSFGLLKIIFNESDSSYSTRLAGICNEKKRRRVRHKKQGITEVKSTKPQTTHYCSTEALVNELQTSTIDDVNHINYENSEDINNTNRASPRIDLLMQKHVSTDHTFLSNDETKTKSTIPTTYRQTSDSSLNRIDPAVSVLYDSPRTQNRFQRPKTAVIPRNQTSVNAIGYPSRLSSPKTPAGTTTTYKKMKKKPLVINRPRSASFVPKHQHSNLSSEISTYSQTLYAGRPLSAVLQSHQRHPPVQRTVDSSCSIREAKGATSRYNKPEELFGMKPSELFGLTEHQPKVMNQRQINNNKAYLQKQQQHIWRQDVDNLIDLYNVHHSSNYRPTAIPPPPPQTGEQTDTITDLVHVGKQRRLSASKTLSDTLRSPTNRQSTFATLNIPRRSSFTRRPSVKLTNA